eukprot:GEMP01061058.1.p1 GENE.GEMP01061058.1~~GEMP01061058.1.p1  ORF type:complete len:150 (+),score=18.96 GEMP01061058.1:641-1090(+)
MEVEVSREILFQDTLIVTNLDYKKFERVPRVFTVGEFTDAEVDIDINVEIYPIEIGDRLCVALSSNVSPSGAQLHNFYDHDPRVLGNCIMDEYEYVMFGTVYKKAGPNAEGLVTIFISFGGLLLRLRAAESHLKTMNPDDKVYLLCRKE